MFVTLALVSQLFVDAADISGVPEALAAQGGRRGGPLGARRVLPVGRPARQATAPSRVVLLIPVGAVALAAGLGCLGVGLLAAA